MKRRMARLLLPALPVASAAVRISLTGLLLSGMLVSLSTQAQTLTWLGTLGGNSSRAYDVSNEGPVVVGTSANASQQIRAFFWTPGTGLQDLGTLGGSQSSARAVSSDGNVIVGWAYKPGDASPRSFRWTATTGMQEIQSLVADRENRAHGISDDGLVIVGEYWDPGDPRAYRWTTQMEDLGTLGGFQAYAYDASADGAVVVGQAMNSDMTMRAFRWENWVMQDLGTLGGSWSEARAVSADGTVIVGFSPNSNGDLRPFRWRAASGMVELPSLGVNSAALDVSANGRYVVGFYVINNTTEERALLWDAFTVPPTIRNLTSHYASLLTPGSYLERATAISPDGRYIVGHGFNAETGRTEGFLLDTQGVTAVDDQRPLRQKTVLIQNYPNPFRSTTRVSFETAEPGWVTLKVLDLLGREVRTLVHARLAAGLHTVQWDGRDEAGRAVAAGLYLYRLETKQGVLTRRLLLVR